jgi:hypothetical protein
MADTPTVLHTRKLFSLNVNHRDPYVVLSPSGERRFVEVTGGTVTGALLERTILPGGSDAQRVRADGVVKLVIRAVLLTGRARWYICEAMGCDTAVGQRCWPVGRISSSLTATWAGRVTE